MDLEMGSDSNCKQVLLLPHTLFGQLRGGDCAEDSLLLFGCYQVARHDERRKIAYIVPTAVVRFNGSIKKYQKEIILVVKRLGEGSVLKFIGLLTRNVQETWRKLDHLRKYASVQLSLQLYHENIIEVKDSVVNGHNIPNMSVIYFNPSDILSSEIISSAAFDSCSTFSCANLITESFSQTIEVLKENVLLTPLSGNIQTFAEHEVEKHLAKPSEGPQTRNGFPSSWRDLTSLTTTGVQLDFRLRQSLYIWRNLRRKNFTMSVGNTMSAVALDTLFGVLLSIFLLQQPNPLFWLENAVTFANGVVNQLKQLLDMLIEMPAGLKLNRPLNTALGEFFQYHIYLWKTYMSIVQPVFAAVAEVIIFSGIFGLTCVLGILCDLLSLATIHIYCFYGYAARLYNFQFNGLGALWRLFRGKKWNPLKQRVDSYSYGNEQLFIGSIAFTILLFLLPTVLLYYLVFLVLRLFTLCVHLVLRHVIAKLSVIPVYAFFLWALGSKRISETIYFDVKNTKSPSDRIHTELKTKCLPFGKLFETNVSIVKSPLASEPFSWSETLWAVLSGKIIYPM